MARIRPKQVAEAEELLAVVATWSEEEIDELPPLYQEKAEAYRQLANAGAD
jgi:hypothetical protein